jgi:hypothetical protein
MKIPVLSSDTASSLGSEEQLRGGDPEAITNRPSPAGEGPR